MIAYIIPRPACPRYEKSEHTLRPTHHINCIHTDKMSSDQSNNEVARTRLAAARLLLEIYESRAERILKNNDKSAAIEAEQLQDEIHVNTLDRAEHREFWKSVGEDVKAEKKQLEEKVYRLKDRLWAHQVKIEKGLGLGGEKNADGADSKQD